METTQESLIGAINVINEVATAFSSLPEEKAKAVEAALALSLASLYLVELSHHLSKGDELYDALVKTLMGQLPLSDSQQTLMKILASPGK